MSLYAAIRHRLRTLLRPAAHARELREEIDFHLSLEAMDQAAGADGSRRSDAPYTAGRRFGNVTRYTRGRREMSGLVFFDMLRQDLRCSFRTFRQAKSFTFVAVATIALGIGATVAIFSVVEGLILDPLPYPDADRVVMVWMDNPRLNLHEDVHSYPNLTDLKAQNRSLSHLEPYREGGFNLTGDGEPQRVLGGVVTARLFDALGARPIVGRLFSTENQLAANDAAGVISDGLWETNFGGDAGIVGKSVELSGRRRTIVGVLPETFDFPNERTQVWLPL